MRAFRSKLFSRVSAHVAELATGAAFGLVSYGVYRIYPAAGFIVGGVLVVLAVVDGRR